MTTFKLQYWLKSEIIDTGVFEKEFASLMEFYTYYENYIEKGIFEIGHNVKDYNWTLLVDKLDFGLGHFELYHNQVKDINLLMDKNAIYKKDILAIKLELDHSKKLEEIQEDIEKGLKPTK